MKVIYFHRFDIAVHSEPWELNFKGSSACSDESIFKKLDTPNENLWLFSRKILIFENLRIFEVENFPFSVVFPEEMFSAEDDELRDAKNCNLDPLPNWTKNNDLGVFKNFSPQKKMWQGIYNEFKISIFFLSDETFLARFSARLAKISLSVRIMLGRRVYINLILAALISDRLFCNKTEIGE